MDVLKDSRHIWCYLCDAEHEECRIDKDFYPYKGKYTKMAHKVKVPDICEICGRNVAGCYDVHMVCQHPETRPIPHPLEKTKKRRKQ